MCLTELVSSGFLCDENPKANTLKEIGISETMITKIIGDEYANAQELVDEKIAFCAKQINNNAAMFFSENVANASLIDDRTVGEKLEGTQTAYAGFGGLIMEVDNTVDLSLNVNNVTIQVNYTGDIDLKIWNITDNVEVHSETVSVVSGVLKNVPLNVQLKTGRRPLKVAVGYDKTGIQSLNYTVYGDCVTCAIRRCGLHVKGYGANFDPTTWVNTRTGHLSGLSVDYSLACLYEKVVCANQQRMIIPMLYKVGAELMVYGMNSNRWNDTDKEKYQNYLNHYSTNYEASIKDALGKIRLPKNECFGCVQRFGTKTITP